MNATVTGRGLHRARGRVTAARLARNRIRLEAVYNNLSPTSLSGFSSENPGLGRSLSGEALLERKGPKLTPSEV